MGRTSTILTLLPDVKQKKDILPMEIEEIHLSLHSPLLDRISQITRTKGFLNEVISSISSLRLLLHHRKPHSVRNRVLSDGFACWMDLCFHLGRFAQNGYDDQRIKSHILNSIRRIRYGFNVQRTEEDK